MSFLIKIRMSMCTKELKWALEEMSMADRSDVLVFAGLQYITNLNTNLILLGIQDRFPMDLTDDEAYQYYVVMEDGRNSEINSYKEIMKNFYGKERLSGNLHHLFHMAQRRAFEIIMCAIAANVKGHEDIIKIFAMLPKDQKQHLESIDRYYSALQRLEDEYPGNPFIQLIESVDKELWTSSCRSFVKTMS